MTAAAGRGHGWRLSLAVLDIALLLASALFIAAAVALIGTVDSSPHLSSLLLSDTVGRDALRGLYRLSATATAVLAGVRVAVSTPGAMVVKALLAGLLAVNMVLLTTLFVEKALLTIAVEREDAIIRIEEQLREETAILEEEIAILEGQVRDAGEIPVTEQD